MRTQANIRDTVDHLPDAAVLVLDGLGWKEYEEILEELEGRPGVRVTFDRGRLEVVTTSPVHEFWKDTVLRLVHVLCEELNQDLESYGGTTWYRKSRHRGTEADACFYVEKAKQVIGKADIQLDRNDPPPDVVVEIDKSNQSRNKFPLYAAFGVPEIWQCDVRRNAVRMFELRSGSYEEIPVSRFFPGLSGAVLLDFIQQSRTSGQTAATGAFRKWVRAQRT